MKTQPNPGSTEKTIHFTLSIYPWYTRGELCWPWKEYLCVLHLLGNAISLFRYKLKINPTLFSLIPNWAAEQIIQRTQSTRISLQASEVLLSKRVSCLLTDGSAINVYHSLCASEPEPASRVSRRPLLAFRFPPWAPDGSQEAQKEEASHFLFGNIFLHQWPFQNLLTTL